MKTHITLYFLLITILISTQLSADRIKDLVSFSGIRNNQLVGYGIVVGLNGTGDQTTQAPFTVQSIRSMLAQMGVTIPPNSNPQLKNVAAVMVTTQLQSFLKPGQTIDITVSSIANAKSLRGGTLLMTPLKGADGKVYAMAQGNLVVGGFGAEGEDGSRITVNIPSVGRIPDGATVERVVNNGFSLGDTVMLNLHHGDFTTAQRVADSINLHLGRGIAAALDSISIEVNSPRDKSQRVAFISMLENLDVSPADPPARIIVNSRTGTVVISQNVKVLPSAVSHGNLIVKITEQLNVSQPNAFSEGVTVVTPESEVDIEEEETRMFVFNPGVSLSEIVDAVNKVGAAPGDLIAILEALKQSGALKAEFIVI